MWWAATKIVKNVARTLEGAPVIWRLNYSIDVLLGFGCRTGEASDFFGGAHSFERTRHDLSRARAVHIISRLRFEQLGVREDDAELIVQPMEEEP
jgi:hypothetical protein